MKRLPLGIASVVLLLSACANTGQLTGKLSPVSTGDSFETSSSVSYVEIRGVAGVRWEEGLLPCKFVAKQGNSEGTFYEGSGKCVFRNFGAGPMGGSPYRGGIWVPKNPQLARRLFYYFDYDVATATKGGGVITGLILEAGRGDLTLMPEIKDQTFLAALQAAYRPRP